MLSKDKDMNLNAGLSESQIYTKLITCSTGAITAYSSQFTNIENKKRTRSLLAKLLYKKYFVTTVSASFIDDYGNRASADLAEYTYLVASNINGDDNGVLESNLIALGGEFDQDFILSVPFGNKAKLVETSIGGDLKLDTSNFIKSDSADKAVVFMNKLNNRLYVCKDIMPPDNYFGKWALYKMAINTASSII